MTDFYCFRHRFEIRFDRCRLCEAKENANGDIQKAKVIFVHGEENVKKVQRLSTRKTAQNVR